MKQYLPKEPELSPSPPVFGGEKFFNPVPRRNLSPAPDHPRTFFWHTLSNGENGSALVFVTTNTDEGFLNSIFQFLAEQCRLDAIAQKVNALDEVFERMHKLSLPFNKPVTESHATKNASQPEQKSAAPPLRPVDLAFLNPENEFLRKVNGEIEKHFTNEHFKPKQIAREVNVCPGHLHHKLKTLARLSPNNYLRKYRLQRSRLLLAETGLSVSDVCFSVGFHSLEYFSRSFKNEFGVCPTTCRQQQDAKC